jgi:hypothetical protein
LPLLLVRQLLFRRFRLLRHDFRADLISRSASATSTRPS